MSVDEVKTVGDELAATRLPLPAAAAPAVGPEVRASLLQIPEAGHPPTGQGGSPLARQANAVSIVAVVMEV